MKICIIYAHHEAKQSFKGSSKDFIFEQNRKRYKKYLDKIIYHKIPESIFDKSTMNCVGGLTLVSGKFDDETGMCTFYLADGEKVFINYKGKGTGGQGGSGTFLIVGDNRKNDSCK